MGTSHFAPFGKVCSENVEQVAVGGVIVVVSPCMHYMCMMIIAIIVQALFFIVIQCIYYRKHLIVLSCQHSNISMLVVSSFGLIV